MPTYKRNSNLTLTVIIQPVVGHARREQDVSIDRKAIGKTLDITTVQITTIVLSILCHASPMFITILQRTSRRQNDKAYL